MRTARAEEAEYAKKLVAAVQAEARNDAWASQKEQELKTSYASSDSPRGGLKAVDCRSTKCELQVVLSPREMPNSPAGPIAALNQWIAASQPCGYTIVAAEALEQRLLDRHGRDAERPSARSTARGGGWGVRRDIPCRRKKR